MKMCLKIESTDDLLLFVRPCSLIRTDLVSHCRCVLSFFQAKVLRAGRGAIRWETRLQLVLTEETSVILGLASNQAGRLGRVVRHAPRSFRRPYHIAEFPNWSASSFKERLGAVIGRTVRLLSGVGPFGLGGLDKSQDESGRWGWFGDELPLTDQLVRRERLLNL